MKVIGIFFFIFSLLRFAQADVFLPLHTLRDQGHTDHCWAYSMAHVLESRALIRDSNQVMFNVEKDIKYWVDYERMMYIHRTKKLFFLGDHEGGWQIEFFETFLKHGKVLHSNLKTTPKILYKPLQDFFEALQFMPEPRPREDSTLPSWERITVQFRTQFISDQDAHHYAINYLNRKYGLPLTSTQWSEKKVPLIETPKLVMGSDLVVNKSVDSLVLIKPVSDGQFGWIQYLNNRYWGYRYDKREIFNLIELSLNNKWPVMFDNVYHAMTIIAFATDASGVKHYAVADSIPGKIVWYTPENLLRELNFLTFFRYAIPHALPIKSAGSMLQLRLPMATTIDQHDNVVYPPR